MPQLAPASPPTPSGLLEAIWLVPDVGNPVLLRLPNIPLGEPFTPSLARRAMRELLKRGAYASVEATTELTSDGAVVLYMMAIERKIVAEVQVNGGTLDLEETLSAAGITAGQEVTRADLKRAAATAWQLYKERGYPDATVSGSWTDAGDDRHVLVTLTVAPGTPRAINLVRPVIHGPALPEVERFALRYGVKPGARADARRLQEADEDLQAELREAGFYGATVVHQQEVAAQQTVSVHITPGPKYRLRFEGLRVLDAASLRSSLELNLDALVISDLRNQIIDTYERHGYFDAKVAAMRVASADGAREDWVFRVREGERLRVSSRVYPCLAGPRDALELDAEIDAILSERLPGGDEIIAPVDPGTIDVALAGRNRPNHVRVPRLEPWTVYAPAEYERALTHLRDLYRSEGYLAASVGPVTPLRRRCDPRTGPERCTPMGERNVPVAQCPTNQQPIPIEDESVGAGLTCRTESAPGMRCEPTAMLAIPVKLGPQTNLWDVDFRGNRLLVDAELFEVADLELGAPVSQIELQRARRRLAEAYGDRGFAYAQVEVELELSQDRTRGKARFIVSEREPVYVRGFVVRGAEETRESLILARLALTQNGLYRRDLVRRSEEQLAELGVFSSVTIELEDPDVPAREKVVVVTVQERPSQYIDIKPGFSTGEGFRIGLEYGHRNLFGRALQLRFRFQLGYLPTIFIIEDEVRRRFEELSFDERLERRNSVTLELPLPYRLRLAIDGIDVRDNSRDFGLTKRAAILTMTHRPSRNISLVTGTSLEDNDVTIFSDTTTLQQYLESNPQYVRLLNVPEGRSFAIAFRAGAAWDGTDNALGATRGAFVSLDAEPVVAYLGEDDSAVSLSQCMQEATRSDACEYESKFIKLTNRIAGYIPFNDKGLSLALSLRTGANLQLVENSVTYPDRLFFFGGSDSLRGHLQDSVIPEDVAERLRENGESDSLTTSQVLIRGGDVVINPRAELRIPLTKLFQTAVFLDAGNVWRELESFRPWILRYAAGTGLRITTPVGPLAFDYGFRLDRRPYEGSDLGAFHFSVGLF